ncbi:TIGR01212 family radical SAM protein [Geopsychrobacter electrodiphilus]|uniref:TIGR01212 family radical SAM protein n=1 Tax=Geopsychrobacter electrodiphilus TaxID=225196 RepID=UPI0003770932|nr:TIGR01212 family radical SAM protein [Geopsychrobacter electrodiphilus]
MRRKAFNLYSTHIKSLFGGRVHKISIDAGFGCPHREGGRAGHGCLFCAPSGSGSVGIEAHEPIAVQVENAKALMRRKYRAKWFIAYFQPFSNTFAPVKVLRERYDQALVVDDVVGLAIGTRPDCLAEDVVDLLAEYDRRTYFWLELGLQSIHDKSLNYLDRGHDYRCFLDSYQRAKERGLKVCVHLILGLPGESRDEILATADEMARLKVDGVKLHLLHVLDGTPLGELYKQGQVPMLEMQDYVELAVDFIERLPPDTLIQRLTGDGPRSILLAPRWSINKWEVLNAIDAELERRDTRQGARCRAL